MSNTTHKRDAAHEAEKAKESGQGAMEKVKDMASHAGQAVGSAASAAGQAVGNAASTVGSKVNEGVGSVGHGMASLGETVREKGPSSGVLGSATEAVANTLEKGGHYLEEKKLSGMADDLTDLIRRNPIPALLIGIGVGFLLARTFRS
jgi:hypothetical protein